jgi:hypothetical protein
MPTVGTWESMYRWYIYKVLNKHQVHETAPLFFLTPFGLIPERLLENMVSKSSEQRQRTSRHSHSNRAMTCIYPSKQDAGMLTTI